MPYAYYTRLKASDKAIYRRSDDVTSLRLPDPHALQVVVRRLEKALEREDRLEIDRWVREFVNRFVGGLDVAPVVVKVLAARPSESWGELHGLYELAEGRRRARITVWMRTAQHKKVVAFRTFLRTVLHELCHHLDYELLELADSFHTEGFFKRESSLFHQLVPSKEP